MGNKSKKKRKTSVVELDMNTGRQAYQVAMVRFEDLIRGMDKYLTGDQVNSVINGAAELMDKYLGEMFPKISIAATVSLFGYVAAMGLSKSIIAGINSEKDAVALTEIFHAALTGSLPAMLEYMKKAQAEGRLRSDVLIIPGRE